MLLAMGIDRLTAGSCSFSFVGHPIQNFNIYDFDNLYVSLGGGTTVSDNEKKTSYENYTLMILYANLSTEDKTKERSVKFLVKTAVFESVMNTWENVEDVTTNKDKWKNNEGISLISVMEEDYSSTNFSIFQKLSKTENCEAIDDSSVWFDKLKKREKIKVNFLKSDSVGVIRV
jgi:hypothetical protein